MALEKKFNSVIPLCTYLQKYTQMKLLYIVTSVTKIRLKDKQRLLALMHT